MRKLLKTLHGLTKHWLTYRRQRMVWTINLALASLSYIGAYVIRFDTLQLPDVYWNLMLKSLPMAVALKIVMLIRFKVFTGLWRYVSAHDLLRLMQAMTLYAIVFIALTVLTFRINIPRSVYVIDLLLSLIFFGGLRLSVRIFREFKMESGKDSPERRFLIIGAGDAAEIATRSLVQENKSQNIVVGYIDDDKKKIGRMLHGAHVLGTREKTPEIIRTRQVTDVLFAISDAPKELTEYIINTCSGLNVSFRILPSFCDIATGRIEVQRIRNVDIEDLLGRRPVRLDNSIVSQDLQGEVVLVTGAAGSIGSELVRQSASFAPEKLIILDAAETPLFEIQQEILQHFPSLSVETVLCNLKNKQAIDRLFEIHAPTRVYHAAAYKHVPMLEKHTEQAVLNNIATTRYLAEAAIRAKSKRFIMISTDKAVRPSSIMGASKRICERLVCALSQGSETQFAAVRFGNVLGSNGSVIPTFRRQISEGGPITITDPNMTRYFMTIPEAAQLVLHCGAIAKENDIFVLDMGTPVRILDLAYNMIRLSGLKPEKDIEIVVTGLRPGEKMHEELVTYGEALQKTEIEKINVLRRDRKHASKQHVLDTVEHLEKLAENGSKDDIKQAIWTFIQEDKSETIITSGSDEATLRPLEHDDDTTVY